MPTPYSTNYNAEDHEHLFHVLDSLLKPDVNHTQNRACRSARALWSPLRADRLLWAKQAWEHPEVDDSKISGSTGGTELVFFKPPNPLLSASTDVGRTIKTRRRSLSKWIDKWCHAFEIPPDQWILALPSRDLCAVGDAAATSASLSNNHHHNENGKGKNDTNLLLLPQLVMLQWDWLLKTLRTALLEWRLDAMFPTLVHPIVHNHWKVQLDQEHKTIVMQCLIFIIRVYCAMKALQWDSMESPVLLTKVLRCATILQDEASGVFQQVDLKVLASLPRIDLPVVDPEIGTTNSKTTTTIHETTSSGHGNMGTHEGPPLRHELVPTTGPTMPSQVPTTVDVTCRNREDVLYLRKRKREDTIFAYNPQASTKVTKRY